MILKQRQKNNDRKTLTWQNRLLSGFCKAGKASWCWAAGKSHFEENKQKCGNVRAFDLCWWARWGEMGWLSWLWLICRMSSTWSSWQPAILAILATTPQNGKAIRTKATEWGFNLAWGNKKDNWNLSSGKQMGMQSGWGQKMQQKCKQHLIHGNKIWSTTTKYGIWIWCLAKKSMNTIWSKTAMLPSEWLHWLLRILLRILLWIMVLWLVVLVTLPLTIFQAISPPLSPQDIWSLILTPISFHIVPQIFTFSR